MQKMRKMQKTQKMKKLRKMQKTRKMKGGFSLSNITSAASEYRNKALSAASSGLSKASELGKEYGKEALNVGKSVASSGLAMASDVVSKIKDEGSAKFSEIKEKIKEKGSDVFNSVKTEAINNFNKLLEKGEERLKGFLEKMGVDESDIDGAIEAISEGDMEALKNNKGLKKLMDEFKNDRLGFFKKAGDAEEELPEAQAVELPVAAEAVEVVEKAEAEVEDAEAEAVEDAEEAEVEGDNKMPGGGMMQNTIDDLFFLVCLVITDGPIEGVAQWRRYLEMVKTPEGRDKINKLYEEEKARAERDPRRGGGKRNKPVKSRKNRKSKKSKSAKKH